MSQTKQNFNFFQKQKHLFKKRFPLLNRRAVGFNNQHHQIDRRDFNSLPQDKFLGFGKAVGININLRNKLKRFLKNYQVIVSSHNFYDNIKRGKAAIDYQNGGVVKRGGNWDNTTNAGVFARNNNWATNGNTNNGARLARYLFKRGSDFLQSRLREPRPKITVALSPAPAQRVWIASSSGGGENRLQKLIITISLLIVLIFGLVALGKRTNIAFAAENAASASAIIAGWQEELKKIAEQNAKISAKLEGVKKGVEEIAGEVSKIVGRRQADNCPVLLADEITVGLWKPSEDESNLGQTIIDYSGKDNHGEIIEEKRANGPRTPSVKVGNSETLNPRQITVEVCYYRQNSQGGPLIQKAYNQHRPPYYQYFLREDGFAAIAVGGEYVFIDTPKSWPGEGKWVYATLTFDGEFLRVYANGELLGEKQAEGGLDSYETEVLFGKHRNYTGSAEFSGIINEVRISDTARTETEISANWGSRNTFTPSTASMPTPEPTDSTKQSATPSASPQPTHAMDSTIIPLSTPSASPAIEASPSAASTITQTPTVLPTLTPTATATPTGESETHQP